MFKWYIDMKKDGRKTFWACASGYALDGMDTQIYSFVVPVLIAVWGLSLGQAGSLATATLLLSAVGGWMAGLLADRIGRVRTLQITILWFAIFTFLSGFALNFDQLLVLGTGSYLGVIIVGSFCGYVTSAYLNDLLGRRRTFLTFAVGSMVVVLIYTQLPITNNIVAAFETAHRARFGFITPQRSITVETVAVEAVQPGVPVEEALEYGRTQGAAEPTDRIRIWSGGGAHDAAVFAFRCCNT